MDGSSGTLSPERALATKASSTDGAPESSASAVLSAMVARSGLVTPLTMVTKSSPSKRPSVAKKGAPTLKRYTAVPSGAGPTTALYCSSRGPPTITVSPPTLPSAPTFAPVTWKRYTTAPSSASVGPSTNHVFGPPSSL